MLGAEFDAVVDAEGVDEAAAFLGVPARTLPGMPHDVMLNPGALGRLVPRRVLVGRGITKEQVRGEIIFAPRIYWSLSGLPGVSNLRFFASEPRC